MWSKYCFIFLLFQHGFAQKTEGDSCIDEYTNSAGVCARAETCQSAREDLQKNGIKPTFCAYTFNGALVCCRDGSSILDSQPPRRATQGDSRPVWGTSDTGRKRISERKCTEYSRGVVHTVDFIPLLPNPETMSVSTSKCDYTKVELIVGGEKANLGEFPHMAAIGWADTDGYAFKCGGSLISPRYVLTAAHCTKDPRAANPAPSIVRLGDQNIDNNVQDGARPVEVAIRNIIPHPDYKAPRKYNDIALLELSTDVDFGANIRPACLWNQPGFGGFDKAVATGWGVVDIRTQQASKELQKVSLTLLENDYCDQILVNSRNRNWMGFERSQVCAGELRGGKDTCQGDSGSPLQVSSKDNQCIFYVMGIVSFGKSCAQSGQPSIYTRVSHYLDWIESVVWPGE